MHSSSDKIPSIKLHLTKVSIDTNSRSLVLASRQHQHMSAVGKKNHNSVLDTRFGPKISRSNFRNYEYSSSNNVQKEQNRRKDNNYKGSRYSVLPRGWESNERLLNPEVKKWLNNKKKFSLGKNIMSNLNKLSELLPECRIWNIEARGGRRNFGKWFQTLPPNVKVDKDLRTDRGVLKKDNFQSEEELNRYLGILM